MVRPNSCIKQFQVTHPRVVAHPSLAIDLLPALDSLQTRLQTLERENGISRRRVRELELELEDCKAEVVVERTRVKEREREQNEEAIWERERERQRQVRGKMREEESRYREVLEEKKGTSCVGILLLHSVANIWIFLHGSSGSPRHDPARAPRTAYFGTRFTTSFDSWSTHGRVRCKRDPRRNRRTSCGSGAARG